MTHDELKALLSRIPDHTKLHAQTGEYPTTVGGVIACLAEYALKQDGLEHPIGVFDAHGISRERVKIESWGLGTDLTSVGDEVSL